MVAALRICGDPTVRAAWASAGTSSASGGEASSPYVTAAPMRSVPAARSSVQVRSSGTRLTHDDRLVTDDVPVGLVHLDHQVGAPGEHDGVGAVAEHGHGVVHRARDHHRHPLHCTNCQTTAPGSPLGERADLQPLHARLRRRVRRVQPGQGVAQDVHHRQVAHPLAVGRHDVPRGVGGRRAGERLAVGAACTPATARGRRGRRGGTSSARRVSRCGPGSVPVAPRATGGGRSSRSPCPRRPTAARSGGCGRTACATPRRAPAPSRAPPARPRSATRLKTPIWPLAGVWACTRHSGSWASSSSLGARNEVTLTPAGLMPVSTSRSTPSLPPASIACSTTRSARVRSANSTFCSSATSSRTSTKRRFASRLCQPKVSSGS